MATEVTIRINGVAFVRNPYNEGSVANLLVHKGVDPEIAQVVEEQCRLTAPGHKVPVKLSGIIITT